MTQFVNVSFLCVPVHEDTTGFWHNLPRLGISKGLIGWCLSVIVKFTYSFFCW